MKGRTMKDHKQEVIGIFDRVLLLEFKRGQGSSEWKPPGIKDSENLYSDIAPLMRGDITWSVKTEKHRRKITIKDGDEEVYSLSCPTQDFKGMTHYVRYLSGNPMIAVLDERSGGERREGSGRRTRISDRRHFGLPRGETFDSRYSNRRILEDRRTK